MLAGPQQMQAVQACLTERSMAAADAALVDGDACGEGDAFLDGLALEHLADCPARSIATLVAIQITHMS